MCDLAALLHLSPSGLTRRLDGLVRKGFVARVALPERSASHAGRPDDQGDGQAREGGATTRRRRPRHLLDHLSRTQIRQLGNVLSTVQRRRSEVAANTRQVGGNVFETTTDEVLAASI